MKKQKPKSKIVYKTQRKCLHTNQGSLEILLYSNVDHDTYWKHIWYILFQHHHENDSQGCTYKLSGNFVSIYMDWCT